MTGDIYSIIGKPKSQIRSLKGKGQDASTWAIVSEDNPPVLTPDSPRDLKDQWFDTVIKMYTDLNQEEMVAFQAQMIVRRETRTNRFAATPSGSWRWALSFPPRLAQALELLWPKWWKNKKEVTRFAKRYPIFTVGVA